jgi:predicted type IV restriction endonuclease
MSKEQKQKILENVRYRYEAMDQSKKKQLLTKNMNYKETMSNEQKQKLLENTRAKYQAMDISKKKDLSATSSSKIMSNRISLDPKQKHNLLDREKEKRMEKKSLTLKRNLSH